MVDRRRPPSVPTVLVRLKLRLLRRRLSQQEHGAVGLIVALGGALLLGTGAAILLASAGDRPLGRDVVPPLVATGLWLAWSLLPLATFGTDETLDPARLALLPLRRRPLVTGLALSSLLGPAPLGVVLGCSGILVGFGAGAAAVVVVPAVLLVVGLSVVTSRMLAATLAAALTSRRGRDVAVVVVSVLGIAVQGVRFLPESVFEISDATWRRAADVAAVLPPGMAGRAIGHAAEGRLALGLVELVPAALLLLAFGALWGRALDRSLALPEARSRRRRPREGVGLRLLRRRPWARPTPTGAVLARELCLARRDPARRAGLFNATLVSIGAAIFVVLTADDVDPRAVMAAAGVSGLSLLLSFNQFGFDGPGLWLDFASPDPFEATFTGKNLATLVQLLPVAAATAVVLAARTGGWVYVPAAILVSGASLLAGLAVANHVSLLAPAPVAERRNPFGGQGGGRGCAVAIIGMVGMAVAGVVLVPVWLPVALALASDDGALTSGVAAVALAYAVAVWAVGRATAVRSARRRFPEVLQAVDPRRA